MLLEEGVCYNLWIFLAKFCWPLPYFISYSKAKFARYSRYLLNSYFCIPVPYNEKEIFLGGVNSRRLLGLHRTIQLQLLQHYWLEHIALEMNRDHSVVFEIASKYCISDSFVDHDGYFISSKGFLPTVGGTMVIQFILVH